MLGRVPGGRPPSVDNNKFRTAGRQVLSAQALGRLDKTLHMPQMLEELDISARTMQRNYKDLQGVLALAESIYTLDGFVDTGAGERHGRNARVIEGITELMAMPELPGEDLLRAAIRIMFDEDTTRPVYEFAPEWLLQIAALAAHDADRRDAEDDTGVVAPGADAAEVARDILEKRRGFYVGARGVFVLAFTELFRRMGVSPKSPLVEIEDIAMAAHAAYDGMLLRHLVIPDLFSLDMATDTLTQMVLSLTTRGAMIDLAKPLLRDLVRQCIEGPDLEVTIESVADAAGLGADSIVQVQAHFKTDEDFAAACLEQRLGLRGALDVAQLVLPGRRGLANEAVRKIANVSAERPALIASAGAQAERVFDSVALEIVAPAFRGRSGLDEASGIAAARALIALARSGTNWERSFEEFCRALASEG